MKRRTFLIGLTILVLAGVFALWQADLLPWKSHSLRTYQIPTRSLDAWTAFGGTWDTKNGIIRNKSDERGAKLITGSRHWSNYVLRADIQFDREHGDMGLVFRSSDEEEGVDAYKGYYAGLRAVDGALVVGRSDYGWMEALPRHIPGGVRPFRWYRLTITAVGCHFVANAKDLNTGNAVSVAFDDPHCVSSGRIGLRSLATGGMWRNIQLAPAAQSDYEAAAAHAGPAEQPQFPRREADYNRVFGKSVPLPSIPSPADVPPATNTLVRSIGDLQNLHPGEDVPVTVRGVVTLVGRQLYIEDASGGLVIKSRTAPSLNVGDVVEVSGQAHFGVYSAGIDKGRVQVISSGTPIPPLAVSPVQAASGVYDARFIELEGYVQKVFHTATGGVTVELYQDGEAFRAVLDGNSTGTIPTLQKGSRVRLRGVCIVGHIYTQDLIPFVVLLRSADDVRLIAGPPWWTPFHLALVFAAILLLASFVQISYFRVQRWKTQAITDERERMAHDIHDTMAQSFAGIGYQIQGIRKSLIRQESLGREQVSEQLATAYQLVRDCHEEASHAISSLSSTRQKTPDVLSILEENVHKLAGSDIQTIAEVHGPLVPLSSDVTAALIQIGKEAISNAVFHAAPTLISFRMQYSAGEVALSIADNGRGFHVSDDPSGFGIAGMRKRAQSIAADFSIMSTPGVGTCITVGCRPDGPGLLDHLRERLSQYLHYDLPRKRERGT